MKNQKLTDTADKRIKKWKKDSLNRSNVYIAVGGRGSGKSCLSYAMLEWHYMETDRPICVYKFPKPELLPKWIKNVNDLSTAPKGAVILIDEGGIEFSQFTSASKGSKDLANKLKVARHKDQSIIFISQSTDTLTKDVNRLVDCYLLRKPSTGQMYNEKPMIKKMYADCGDRFKDPDMALRGFFISDIGEMAKFDLPTFWTDAISKAYDGEVGEVPNISRTVINVHGFGDNKNVDITCPECSEEYTIKANVRDLKRGLSVGCPFCQEETTLNISEIKPTEIEFLCPECEGESTATLSRFAVWKLQRGFKVKCDCPHCNHVVTIVDIPEEEPQALNNIHDSSILAKEKVVSQ
ncbi:MAG: hypothetical protein GY861_17190 [bacterium]|nr:hypothetical protein [bacterium]